MSLSDFLPALPALGAIGWNSYWTRTLATTELAAGTLARVVERHRDHCRLHDGGAVFIAAPHPRLDAGDGLAVGDWVMAYRTAGVALITQQLPRQCLLARGRSDGSRQALVANVDCALLLMGLDGDYSPNRLERYLLLVRAAEVMPVVVLTKPDRCPEIEARLAEIQRLAGALTPVHAIDPREAETTDALLPYLSAGQTLVLLGSSGVGKSTLMNALLGTSVQATQATRHGDDTGRHTTTARTLRALPGGACLIDTPGLRELRLAGDETVAQHGFDEIRALAAACRFADCRHEHEPGCAVVAGIDPSRLANYHKLRRELEALSRSPQQLAARKQQDRVIHQEQKRYRREHDKRR